MSEIDSGELVTQLDSSREVIVVRTAFPGISPDTPFAYWTQPDLITRWWPKTAEIDPRAGGTYHLAWPDQNWHLRGHYTAFEPGRQLSFTWVWDHDPTDETTVSILFLPMEAGGMQLTLTHGPYADTPEGQERRQGHIDGWQHFLTRLHHVIDKEIK
jgi:uncharacterized protein YndB with AHSA1/START domain